MFLFLRWMGVASVGTRSSSVVSSCSRVPGLSSQQRKMCILKPDVIPSVSEGAKIAIEECKQQFNHERWNCSTSNDATVFGRLLEIGRGQISRFLLSLLFTVARVYIFCYDYHTLGSKETAFVHAITSAGVVHAVSKSCSRGNLTECTCNSKNKKTSHPRGWEEAGCSDNVKYAIWLSQTFVDAPDKNDRRARSLSRGRALMNLHNNQAGRQVSL